jgi:ABC-type protease/lipase transport system fused ATPase/permease subunit
VTLLVVMTNFASLLNGLPAVGSDLPWLCRFLLVSFVFNLVAMMEQVLTLTLIHTLTLTEPDRT